MFGSVALLFRYRKGCSGVIRADRQSPADESSARVQHPVPSINCREGTSPPAYCKDCQRVTTHFDSWLLSYLGAREVDLEKLPALDSAAQRDISELVYLHGSPGMRERYLQPTFISAMARRGAACKSASDMEFGPGYVHPHLGSIYMEAKAELSLHCQCPTRVATECGGRQYTVGWQHPCGEEVSGADLGPEEGNIEQGGRWSRASSIDSTSVSLPIAADD